MILPIAPRLPRVVHITGHALRCDTGEPLGSTELVGLPISDGSAWITLAKSLRGQYAILVTEGESAVAITDLTGSYPVFRLWGSGGELRMLASSFAELEPGSTRTIRRTALYQYVAFGGMDLEGASFYTDIDRLPGNSVALYADRKWNVTECRNWLQMLQCPLSDLDEAERRLRSTLLSYLQGVLAGTVLDEPVAILLSGGTDSTLLVSLLREGFRDRLRCYTQHFRLSRYSELLAAQRNSGELGLRTEAVLLSRWAHYEATVALNSKDQDQPTATTQAFNLWSILQSASGQCRFFLTGEHADSLFLGFGHFFSDLPMETNRYIAATAALTQEEKLRHVLPAIGITNLDKEFLGALGIPASEYMEWLSEFGEARRRRFGEFLAYHLTSVQQLGGQIEGGTGWQRIMLPVVRSLRGVDIVTPFFDSAMIEFAIGLAVNIKYRDGTPKFLLRHTLSKYISTQTVKRPAAASPVAIWRLLPSLQERARVSPVLRKYYDHVALQNLATGGRIVNHYIRVAALALWMGSRGI